MSTYSYKNPKFINSRKGVVEVVEVTYDGEDDPAYSLAIIKWENTYKLGIRWNIAYSECCLLYTSQWHSPATWYRMLRLW